MKNMKRKVLSFVLLTTLGLTASLAMTSCGGDSSSSSSSTSSTSSSVQLPKMPTPVLSKINYGSMTYTWEDVNNDGGYIYELNGQQFEVSRPEKIPLKPGDTLKVKVKSGLPTLYQDSDWSEPIIVPIKYINVTFEYEVGDKEPHTEQYLCFSEEEFPTPEIPGYTFSHWYMKGESINHKYTGVPNTWEEDATLVGAFIPNDYKITYGNYDVKVTYTTGDSILDAKYNLPKDITLNNDRQTYGYVEPYLYELESRNKVFAGWYADEELTIPFDFEQFITQDTTIYAKILDYEKLYYAHDEGKVYMISNDRNEYSKYYTA